MAKVWVDETRCSGCGACVAACPSHAIKLVAGKARVDLSLCRGCEACVGVCPLGAIAPAVEGEVVEAPITLGAQAHKPDEPVEVRQVAAVSAATPVVRRGAGLLLALEVLQGVAGVVDRWLASRSRPVANGQTVDAAVSRPVSAVRARGHRLRYRRRGRRV